MAFHTIAPSTGLDPSRRRAAHRAGPFAVAIRTTYEQLLTNAGFKHVEARDDTAAYGEAQARWIEATLRHETALRRAMGDMSFDQRLAERLRMLAAVESGLLTRIRYTAIR